MTEAQRREAIIQARCATAEALSRCLYNFEGNLFESAQRELLEAQSSLNDLVHLLSNQAVPA